MKLRKVALLLWLVALLALHSTAGAAPSVGQGPLSLIVPELDGGTFDLGRLRGKVVIVNFWATWCVPCRQEMPELDSFYRQYHDRGVELIGLSADRPRDRGDVQKVLRTLSYPIAMASDATSNDLDLPRILPVTYVIDSDGVLRFVLRPDEAPLTLKSLADVVLPLVPAATDKMPH